MPVIQAWIRILLVFLLSVVLASDEKTIRPICFVK